MQIAKEGKTKKKDGNLKRWINEDWRNLTPYAEGLVKSINETPECGKPHPKQKGKSICRPYKKVSQSTPTLATNYSKEELKKAVEIKNRGETINWNKLTGGNASSLQGLGYALGDDDIKKELPDAKIMDYEGLKQYNNIDELLPNNGDYVIILYEHQQNSGHWVALARQNDRIFFFCSYGVKIDGQLKWVDYNTRKELGSDIPHLTHLVDNSPYDIYYNDVAYQSEDQSIATCGKYVIVFIKSLKSGKDLLKFNDWMKENKPKDMTYDEWINDIWS